MKLRKLLANLGHILVNLGEDHREKEKKLEVVEKPKYIELSSQHQEIVDRMEKALQGKSDTVKMEGVIYLQNGPLAVNSVKEAKEVIEKVKLGELELEKHA